MIGYKKIGVPPMPRILDHHKAMQTVWSISNIKVKMEKKSFPLYQIEVVILKKDDRRNREKVDSKNTNDDDEVSAEWAGLLHLFFWNNKKELKI